MAVSSALSGGICPFEVALKNLKVSFGSPSAVAAGFRKVESLGSNVYAKARNTGIYPCKVGEDHLEALLLDGVISIIGFAAGGNGGEGAELPGFVVELLLREGGKCGFRGAV
jgi:hypothetical protein